MREHEAYSRSHGQEEMADKDMGIANKVASTLRSSLQQIEGRISGKIMEDSGSDTSRSSAVSISQR